MANRKKFVDRNPLVQTAGLPSEVDKNFNELLQFYPKDEIAEYIHKRKCKEGKFEYKLPRHPIVPVSTIDDVFSTELRKSRFVSFREKFSEDMYFKKPELGKVYNWQTKPDNITNENTTFGKESGIKPEENMYDLILPKKTRRQVDAEYNFWHDKYKLSHNHYYPSERIDRNYDRNSFDPKATFGTSYVADFTGSGVKKCMTHCNRIKVISKAQKKFLEQSMGLVGERLTKSEKNLENVTMGKVTPHDECNATALIQNINKCQEPSPVLAAIAHVIKLRKMFFKRRMIYIQDLKRYFREKDVEKTGFLTLQEIIKICRKFTIYVEPQKIRIALKYYGMLVDEGLPTERVDHEQFANLLSIRSPIQKVTGSLFSVPENMDIKDTTYRLFCKDIDKPLTDTQLEYDMLLTSHKERRGEVATTAKDIIQPDINMQMGLQKDEYEKPRDKKLLRRIFQELFDEEKFNELWTKARNTLKPENDEMSVNDLREILRKERLTEMQKLLKTFTQ